MEKQSKVLVVDDDPFALRSIADVLGGESYQVVTAASGSEALDLLRQDSFHLVLADLKMPEVDGLEVLRQARELAPQAVVLMLTGYASVESAIEALREGAYDYLVKPCSADELKLKIERGLERVRLAEERQRAEEAIRQRTAQLEALRQVGLEITAQLDLDTLLRSIVSRAMALVGGTCGGLYLYRPDQDVLEWAMAVGPHLAPIGTILHRGEGLSGKAWETGQPLIVDDYQAWEGRATVYEGYPFGVVVGMPVRWGEEFLGVLNVLADPPRTFSPADAELLSLFATQAAIAIRNARLYEEARSRAERLAVVNRIAQAASATLHLDDLMETVYREVTSVFEADAFFLALYNEEINELDYRVRVDEGVREPRERRPLGTGVTSLAVTEKKPVLIQDFEKEKDHLPEVRLWGTMKLPASWLGVPMQIGEQVIGVICVQAYRPNAYSEEEERLLSTIADQVAVAVENARLYEETRRRALEQETVSRIAYALNTPDVREAFPVLVEGLQDLTGCNVVSLIVLDEAGEQFITTVLESPFPIPGQGEVMPLSATAAAEDVEAGRPHLTADLSTETHCPLEQTLYQAGLRSQVTLPLLVGGEVFGALNLSGSDAGLFREDQLPVLRQIADAVAPALENSFIFQAEREQRELAKSLEEATAALTATLDFDQVLERILEQVSHVVPNDAANIMLVVGDRTRIVRWRGYERFGVGDFVSTVVFRIPEVPGFQQMLNSKEPMVIPDIATYSGWVRVPATEWLRSYVAAPIVVRGEVIGFLNVDSATPGFFTQADAEALRAFADHAAAAIENARLYEAEQRRRHIAETLRQASTVLSSTLELGEVLGLILQQLRQVMPYDSASIQQLQDGYLEIAACQGFEEPDKVVGLVFPLDPKFPNHRVITTKAPLAIEDVTQDYPHFKNEADTYESGRIRSWLGVPLIVKDQVIGMIAVDRAEVHPYTAEEVQLAMAFANQAAIAIENARLFEETERLRAFNESVVQGVAEAILIEDAQGILTFANPAAEELLGYTHEELIGFPWSALVPEDEIEKVHQETAKRPQGVMSRYETALLSREERVIPVIVSARPLFEDGKFVGVLSAFTDITARKRMEETLRALALIDDLTGLYNRRGFLALGQQQLKMADRTKRRMLLLFADFDDLKRINDTFGHPEGDRALIEVASVLRETFRESDIMARIAGDEFVVLAIETNGFPAEVLTTRLQENLEAHNARGGRHYKLSLSVGLARYDPERPCSIDELVARADRAMYERKQDNQR
jgi:diguanylate cyclase (GGDEF)-like protein/PAS domain S-box-containing protein